MCWIGKWLTAQGVSASFLCWWMHRLNVSLLHYNVNKLCFVSLCAEHCVAVVVTQGIL